MGTCCITGTPSNDATSHMYTVGQPVAVKLDVRGDQHGRRKLVLSALVSEFEPRARQTL